MSDQLVAVISTWQHTTDKHLCPRSDSNPQSQQANGRRPTIDRAATGTATGRYWCLDITSLPNRHLLGLQIQADTLPDVQYYTNSTDKLLNLHYILKPKSYTVIINKRDSVAFKKVESR
jgi:hypothetical protein